MSETPRTDAYEREFNAGSLTNGDVEILNFTRTLERDLTTAEQQLAAVKRDAERYRWLQHRVSGDRYPSGVARFRLPDIPAHEGIFKGSVAQHLDAAIDALAGGEKDK